MSPARAASAWILWGVFAATMPAAAQEPVRRIADLQQVVSPGETLHLRTADGHWTRGTLVALDSGSMTLLTGDVQRVWSEADLREVRRADSLTNGGWIGGLLMGFAGFWLGGFTAIATEGLGSDNAGFYAILGGSVGAGLGVVSGRALDARRPGPVVFRKDLAIHPIASLTSGGSPVRGVQVTISF